MAEIKKFRKLRDLHEIAALIVAGKHNFNIITEEHVVYVEFDDDKGDCAEILSAYTSGQLQCSVILSFAALKRARDIVLGEKRNLTTGGNN